MNEIVLFGLCFSHHELNEFLQDLTAWEHTVQENENKRFGSAKKTIPAVRGQKESSLEKKGVVSNDAEKIIPKKEAAGHTYDYFRDKWDKFDVAHQFQKPNDKDALLLMNASAVAVVEDLADIIFAYGVSDEYSFVLRKISTLYQRRASKLISVTCSLFASSYVMNWCKYFPNTKLQCPPAFDGRAVCYPSDEILRDYLSWRQVDCHINNQYNTCFWNIVGAGKSTAEAQNILKGTTADVKNNLLFDTFKINYNDLPQIFRKGSIVYRKKMEKVVKVEDGQEIKRLRSCVVVEHEDIIRDGFWRSNPHILSGK